MIHKTRGIVFRFTKFRETSIIVTIFTEEFGVQSYIVNGVRSSKSNSKIALFQPLTLLNLVVYHREKANIERIKESSCYHPYTTIIGDVKKSSIAMFLTEVLNKTVKEESHTGEVFNFISESLITLDGIKQGYENFHLLFMLKLSRYLGFGAHHVNEVVGGKMADEKTEEALGYLLKADYHDIIPMSTAIRRNILDLLAKFYSEHMENISEFKTLPVLKEVLS